MAVGQFDRITMDPGVLGGKPCVRGLRMSVGMIVQMVAAGKSVSQIVDEYPYLEAEDVRQALEYSAALAERISSGAPALGVRFLVDASPRRSGCKVRPAAACLVRGRAARSWT
ncbi:MAG: DUF433 domain-containing protein, partial [Trebonia sp.]